MIFTDKWWALVIRGIAAVLFGLMAFVVPGITLGALVLLFAAYALVDGIFAIAAAINRTDRSGHWGSMLLRGIVGILAGITAIGWPGITALALLYVIAAWAIVTGILEISAAIRLRKRIKHEWLEIVSGVVSVLFGLAVMAFPGAGILAVLWLVGSYAMAFGVLMIAFGFELRSLGRRLEPGFEERRAA